MDNNSEHLSDICGYMCGYDKTEAVQFLQIVLEHMVDETRFTKQDIDNMNAYIAKVVPHTSHLYDSVINSFVNNYVNAHKILAVAVRLATDTNFKLIYNYFRNNEVMCSKQHNPLTWVNTIDRYFKLLDLGFVLAEHEFNEVFDVTIDVFGCTSVERDNELIAFLKLVMQHNSQYSVSDSKLQQLSLVEV